LRGDENAYKNERQVLTPEVQHVNIYLPDVARNKLEAPAYRIDANTAPVV
jgi:hypothetical protein